MHCGTTYLYSDRSYGPACFLGWDNTTKWDIEKTLCKKCQKQKDEYETRCAELIEIRKSRNNAAHREEYKAEMVACDWAAVVDKRGSSYELRQIQRGGLRF